MKWREGEREGGKVGGREGQNIRTNGDDINPRVVQAKEALQMEAVHDGLRTSERMPAWGGKEGGRKGRRGGRRDGWRKR